MAKPTIEIQKEPNNVFKGSNIFLNIPAAVAHDTDLRPMSRLLYGEINSMMNVTHEFHMSNAAIEKRLGMTDPTLRACFHELEDKGYIQRHIIKDENGRTLYRTITTNLSISFESPEKTLGGPENILGGVGQNTLGGLGKNLRGGRANKLGVNRAYNRAYNRTDKDIVSLSLDTPSEPPKKKKKRIEIAPRTKAVANEIIPYLNSQTGAGYRPTTESYLVLIQGRLNSGLHPTVEDFKTVIDYKVKKWLHDPKMVDFLRPATLFSLSHFGDYLSQARMAKKAAKDTGTDESFEEMAKDTPKAPEDDDLPF